MSGIIRQACAVFQGLDCLMWSLQTVAKGTADIVHVVIQSAQSPPGLDSSLFQWLTLLVNPSLRLLYFRSLLYVMM